MIRSTKKLITESDMAIICADLVNWTTIERRLWVLSASTGAALYELSDIESEKHIEGYRVIALGKTGAMKRQVVIPACAEPFLPAIIEEPLFPLAYKYLEKKMRARLSKLDIGNDKGLSSLRLRAEARLENDKNIPALVTDTILGRGGLTALVNPPSFAAIAKAINVIGIGEI